MIRNLLFYITFSILTSGCASFGPTVPAPVHAPAAQSAVPPARSAPQTPPRAQRSEALLQALLALGLDYRYGGNSPVTGFDCSGLVAHVYLEAWNIRLPRSARAQSEAGTLVSLAELQAGDLVFYDTLKRPFSHVGIYLGDGRFVHAPKTGARVRVESLKSAYWSQRFNGARRIEPPL
ncbi:MAG: C40 family peptidase [Pseudomonadota bacterium]